nr:BREX system ATP-binding domain-containing protein [Tepidiforma sp.]
MNDNAIGARWAIEALRNGVPNRHAVALLGTFQQRIEERFRQQALETAVSPGTRGFLVRADFGAGKSHLLYALQQIASDLSFATATLAVSKETPLSSFPRTARTILRQLRLPDMEGTGLPAAATRAKFQSEDWLDLQTWADGLEFGGGWWGRDAGALRKPPGAARAVRPGRSLLGRR